MSTLHAFEEMGVDEIRDHLLVRSWLNREAGHAETDHCLSDVDPQIKDKLVSELVRDRILIDQQGELILGEKGEDRARLLIRRHRLAERLFTVVFNFSEEVVHALACRMEHEKMLSPEAADGICAFLGHPPTCPHGRPIPAGNCCQMFTREVKPLVMPLHQGDVGENYQIIFMAPKYHDLLERLSGLGVAPGATLTLSQKKPTFVIRAHETEIALDEDVCSGIYVIRQNRAS